MYITDNMNALSVTLGLARVIFLTYNNLEQFLQPQGDGPLNDMGMVETEVHSVEPIEEGKGPYLEAKGIILLNELLLYIT